ncbi:gamma-glutamyl peptidase 3-like [Cynara cardunculus var. scolymus]|nr:gamma-glutamyl peptidase 3-like [Cynara cardunculus var. scolymus]
MGIESERKKRYALLLAARDSEYVMKVYGGYFNVFLAAFGEEEEEERWDLYRVVDGEFPDTNELQAYDGFVVSGSPYDAYGDDTWILELCFLLQTLDCMQKKVLGICFGHQVLCRALGGKVGKSHSGWDIGLRKVKIVKDFSPCSFLESLHEMPPSLSIIECHQDEVWEVPTGAEVIAFSDKTGVEMFTIGTHILGIQGHPEYTKDILNNLIDRLLTQDSIETGLAEDARLKLEIAEPDRKCWQQICKAFLKGYGMHTPELKYEDIIFS